MAMIAPGSEVRGFEAGDQLLAAILEPWREDQSGADGVCWLVQRPSSFNRPRDLEECATWRADIAGLEVVPILLVGNVGEAEAFDMRLQLQLVLLVDRVEGEVMDGAATLS